VEHGGGFRWGQSVGCFGIDGRMENGEALLFEAAGGLAFRRARIWRVNETMGLFILDWQGFWN
jgi:hypothetical protein